MVPYLALYYHQLGFSGIEVGILAATLPLGAALFAPIWGAVADSFGIHRLVLRVALVLAAINALLLTWASTFLLNLILLGAVSLFAAPLTSLVNSYGVTISQRQGLSYGRLRVWGSFGYAISVWLVGRLMERAESGFFLIAYAIALLFAFGATLGLPPLNSRSTRRAKGSLMIVMRNWPMILMLATTFLVSSSTSIIYNYLGIYLTELGGDTQLIGTAFALSSISQWPIMIFGSWFFARLGAKRMLTLAIVIYIVRLLFYSVLPAAEWVLPVQLLHGLSYGVYVMASVTLVHQLAGRELAATAQGLLTSMSLGFGMIVGTLAGGVLIDWTGITSIFYLSATVMMLALLVFLAGSKLTSL